MKTKLLITICSLTGALATHAGPATNAKPARITNDFVVRGMEFRQVGQTGTANQFFRQAMLSGDSEGAYLSGCALWESSCNSAGRQRLLQQRDAMECFFRAATNLHPAACTKISQAFQLGQVVQTNRIAAYVWLKLALEGDATGQLAALDQLAIRMTAEDLAAAQAQARHYRSGHWPEHITAPMIDGDSRLRITGITTGIRKSVMINRVTFQVGDSTTVPIPNAKPTGNAQPPSTVQLSCLDIGSDYVLIQVIGEEELRLLALDSR
jgi:hypothetical protein